MGSQGPKNIDGGSVLGATRHRVVEAQETIRAKVLSKALQEVKPKSTRAAWAWRQRDKVSSSWLLAIPSHDNCLSSAEFSEAAASNLCLPSPACKGRVGERIQGRVVIDEYGDNVQASPLPGDHWWKRHNAVLHLLHRLCMWAGVPAEMEVFNLFSGIIQQEGLSRLEKAQQRQGLVPDMRITLPVSGGIGGFGGDGPGSIGSLAGQSSPDLHELSHPLQPDQVQANLAEEGSGCESITAPR